MNRKLLHGFLASVLLVGAAVSVTSCKDTEEDLFDRTQNETKDLSEKVSNLKEVQDKLDLAQKACKQKCDSIWNDFTNKGEYKGTFDEMLNQYIKTLSAQKTIEWYLNQINDALKGKAADGSEVTYTSLADRLGKIDLAIYELQNLDLGDIFGGAEGAASIKQTLEDHNVTFPDVIIKALRADSLSQVNKAAIEGLQAAYEADHKSLDSIKPLVAAAQETADSALRAANKAKDLANALALEQAAQKGLIDGLRKDADSLRFDVDALYASVGGLRIDVDSLFQSVDTLTRLANRLDSELQALTLRVAANEQKIDSLDKRVKAITGQFNKLVTGIVLQQVTNPIFGKVNIPLDIKSNILMAYFGDGRVNFPAIASSLSEFDSKSIWISAADAANAGITSQNISGVYGVDENNQFNLGSIYLTVNPAGLDVTGANWQLVNSKGEENGIKLTPLAKSDELLMFGAGRAANVPNGFYKTDAYYTVNSLEDLDALKFSFTEGFKSDMAAMLKSHTLSDVAGITKLIFDQFNNRFAAYGVRAWWEYQAYDETTNAFTEGVNATYSDFALAATAIHPLSYKFLYGKPFRPIRTISAIQDFNLNDFVEINVPQFSFNLDGVTFGFTFPTIKIEFKDDQIMIHIPGNDVTDANGDVIGHFKDIDITGADLQTLQNTINESLTKAFEGKDAELQAAFTNAMTTVADKINGEINTEMSKFQKDINDQINKINDKINGYLGTVNKYINKVNGVIKRANNLLKDPNHYLQVTMLYEGNDGELRHLSNTPALPTFCKLNVENAGLQLFATSFNGELIVPSFKKFVAVTNAYKTSDKNKATVTSAIAAANSSENFNKVIDGTTTGLAMKLQSGYTYEIVYSSLDFHGVTSTRKFYVTAE